MKFELLHPADQLVMIMNRIYYRGMTTTSGGNLSVRDASGGMWITPGGVDKGSLTRDDIVYVSAEGKAGGPEGGAAARHKPSSEYPFHLAVLERRPDIGAVLHAHSPGIVASSIVRKIPELLLTPHAYQVCGKVSMASYALPGSRLLGERIAEEFAAGSDVVMLENHGVVIGAKDIFEAFMIFETLESVARLEINARRLGKPRLLGREDAEESIRSASASFGAAPGEDATSEEKALRRDLVKFIHRSYGQGLFTSTQGTYSARIPGGGFVITPYGKDRMYLEAEDLVRFKDGRAEEGKAASRAALLHEEIYRLHPNVGSILVAQPPHLMAFAVTDEAFDTRTIPESYILLRELRRLSYGTSFRDRTAAASSLDAAHPILLCDNDCVIVTGRSLLEAFDRLEVAEFSARSLIDSRSLGRLAPIGQAEIEELERAFGLPPGKPGALPRAVLFDVDGVLVDSEVFIAEAGAAMFRELYGLAVDLGEFSPFVGTGEDRYIGGVAERRGVVIELPKAKARIYELYLELIKGRLKPVPGAVELVHALRKAGIRTAIATSADRIKLLANLKEAGLKESDFDAVLTGLDVARKKPYPDIYLEAARRIGVAPSDCLVIEDAPEGIRAGRAAGARCLGLSTTFPKERLIEAGAASVRADLRGGFEAIVTANTGP